VLGLKILLERGGVQQWKHSNMIGRKTADLGIVRTMPWIKLLAGCVVMMILKGEGHGALPHINIRRPGVNGGHGTNVRIDIDSPHKGR
jgi:hypothetical protein